MPTDKPNRRDLVCSILPAIIGGINAPRESSPEAASKVVAEAFGWADAILDAWPATEYDLKGVS